MNWSESISRAIEYIESNLTNDITTQDIANYAYIFKEWLPNSNDYEIVAGYNIEMYSDPKEYKKGINDEKYYSEVWIPIKKK